MRGLASLFADCAVRFIENGSSSTSTAVKKALPIVVSMIDIFIGVEETRISFHPDQLRK
jgi:hypothetical protein